MAENSLSVDAPSTTQKEETKMTKTNGTTKYRTTKEAAEYGYHEGSRRSKILAACKTPKTVAQIAKTIRVSEQGVKSALRYLQSNGMVISVA